MKNPHLILAALLGVILALPVLADSNKAIKAGQEVVLSVAVEGTAPFTYQWKKNGANLPGATEATYRIASFTAADAGAYRVEITNPAGSTLSDTGTLTTLAPPNNGTVIITVTVTVSSTGAVIVNPGN